MQSTLRFTVFRAAAAATAVVAVALVAGAVALVTPVGQLAPGRAGAFAPAPLTVADGRGAVAADHPDASRAGAEILAKGGNAADAAIATALALGVVSPMSSGLGGGGFAVVLHTRGGARMDKVQVLDFRETAPAAATRDLYVRNRPSALLPLPSKWGGLSVAVPGEPAGLVELHARYGRLPLAEIVRPAVRLAREGVVVSRAWAEAAHEVARHVVVPEGDPLRPLIYAPDRTLIEEGALVKRPELARALELLGQKGRDGFYAGPVGEAIVAEVKRRGGILTAADLAGYKPLWREPLVGRYRGHTLYLAPPPAGGLTVLETLQTIDARTAGAGVGPLGLGSSAADHVVAESLKHAFADRAHLLGDPAFTDVPVARLASADYARELAGRIADDKVLPLDRYGTAAPAATPPRDKGTTHLSVIDDEGNVVALTTTVNLLFGSGVVASGVVLNDEMDDFVAEPGKPNAFGLVGGESNAIAPGKRPLSSTSPTVVVKDQRAVAVVGASGGPHIVSATVQVLLNVLDHGLDAQAAVNAPRLHAQWLPDKLLVERDIPVDVRAALERRGHKVQVLTDDSPAARYGTPPHIAAVQLLVVGPKGRVEAASDPRKGGAPAAPALKK